MSTLLIILFLCMFGIATGFSMLGQGGGSLYTPLQVFFGINFHEAATTSLFLIIVTSLSATLVFRKAHKVDWPLAFVLEGVTAAGGLVGGLGSGQFSGTFLSVVLALVIAFAAFFMVKEFHHENPCLPIKWEWASWHRRFNDQTYCVNLVIALPVSFIAGAVSGLVGVGGGILKVPLMVLLLGIPMDIAVGSSGFMVGLTAVGGFAGHVALGHWDWRTSIVLGIAVFIGGQIGARRSIKIDKKKLKKGFGWFLMLIAALMVGKAIL